jgi:hypothetical protein
MEPEATGLNDKRGFTDPPACLTGRPSGRSRPGRSAGPGRDDLRPARRVDRAGP